MSNDETFNIVGALALALTDKLVEAAQAQVPSDETVSAIALIGHAKNLSIRQLSEVVGLTHPATVRLVDRLCDKGAVIRSRSQQDARAICLSLTPEGAKIYLQVLEARKSVLITALAVLTEQERSSFGRLAAKMLCGIIQNGDHARKVCRLCDDKACQNCPLETELSKRTSA